MAYRSSFGMVLILALGLALATLGCGEVVDSPGDAGRGDPVCATACGLHQACAFVDAVSSDATCACAPGYVDMGSGCAWKGGGANNGGLRDPKLNDPTVWQRALIAFDPTAFSADNGSVSFMSAFGLCGESVLSQTFDMPEYKNAEPFVLEMQHLSQDTTGGQGDAGAVVRFGGSDEIVPFTTRNGTIRMCLGENAYGRNVKFELVPFASGYVGACRSGQNPPPSRLFRTIEIKPATPGECAAPGVFANSKFDANTEGWTYPTTGIRVANPNGVLRLAATSGNGSISASTPISIPKRTALQNPALRFKYNTMLGNADYMTAQKYVRQIRVQLNQQTLGLVYPNDGAAAATASFCLPDWTAGMAYTLQFIGYGASNTGFPAGATDYYYMFLDDIELVSDATCSFDGSFDRPAHQSSWIFDKGITQRVPLPAGYLQSATLAHTGTGVIDFEPARDQGYYSPRLERLLKVPAVVGAAKPVVTFWHRAVSLPPFTVSTSPAAITAAPTTAWEQQSLCIDPRMAGQLMQFSWSIGANADAAVHHYYLDDIDVTTSTSCP
jgi:hypothetical protein